jgi:hypothetical protein
VGVLVVLTSRVDAGMRHARIRQDEIVILLHPCKQVSVVKHKPQPSHPVNPVGRVLVPEPADGWTTVLRTTRDACGEVRCCVFPATS